MNKTIMIVDDSASIRQVLSMSLKGAGYDVIEAVDGRDATAKLGSQKLNLIISDVNMPNLDGIGFLKEVKKHPKCKFTPVIMLTTEGSKDKMAEGRAAGAKAWVVKPFQPKQLLDAVSKLVLP